MVGEQSTYDSEAKSIFTQAMMPYLFGPAKSVEMWLSPRIEEASA